MSCRQGVQERCPLAGDPQVESYQNTGEWFQGQSFRYNRTSTLTTSQSLEMFVEEESTLIKRVLEKYADNMMSVNAAIPAVVLLTIYVGQRACTKPSWPTMSVPPWRISALSEM